MVQVTRFELARDRSRHPLKVLRLPVSPYLQKMVRIEGFEPPPLSGPAPKAGVAAVTPYSHIYSGTHGGIRNQPSGPKPDAAANWATWALNIKWWLRRDSNPQHTVFKTVDSANWSTQPC